MDKIYPEREIDMKQLVVPMIVVLFIFNIVCFIYSQARFSATEKAILSQQEVISKTVGVLEKTGKNITGIFKVIETMQEIDERIISNQRIAWE